MYSTIPDIPDAKLEASHARVNITMQMQQKCLHQAAAASILYFELHWKSLMVGGGVVQMDFLRFLIEKKRSNKEWCGL